MKSTISWAKAYQDLPYIDDAIQYSEADKPLFKEIKAVLKNYGLLNKLGVTLLHTHFPVHQDEIMVEEHDVETNIKHSAPRPKAAIKQQGLVPTSWRITEEETLGFEYGKVSDIDQSQLLTSEDMKCFDELRKVLKKYDALNRFGLTLIDKNPLPEGKIWLETNSVLDRTLMMQVVAGKGSNNNIQTNWRFDSMNVFVVCTTECLTSLNGGTHENKHGGGSISLG